MGNAKRRLEPKELCDRLQGEFDRLQQLGKLTHGGPEEDRETSVEACIRSSFNLLCKKLKDNSKTRPSSPNPYSLTHGVILARFRPLLPCPSFFSSQLSR